MPQTMDTYLLRTPLRQLELARLRNENW